MPNPTTDDPREYALEFFRKASQTGPIGDRFKACQMLMKYSTDETDKDMVVDYYFKCIKSSPYDSFSAQMREEILKLTQEE